MPSHPQRVLIVGRSLLLDSVRAALQLQTGIELIPAPNSSGSDLPDPDALARLQPDVILYAGVANPSVWQAWLGRLPNAALIALDSGTQNALVYHGEVRHVATLNDLARLILVPDNLSDYQPGS
jgi:hypothetical protein